MKTYRGAISDGWLHIGCDFPLQDFARLVDAEIGEPFKRKPDSQVYRIEVREGMRAYLKRYSGLSPIRACKRLAKMRWPHTVAYDEYRMAELLQAHGFDVMEPIAWAECRIGGLVPVQGAVLVKEVPGIPFNVIFDNEAHQAARSGMLYRLGQLYARLHLIGYWQMPRTQDLICSDPDQVQCCDMKLYIIDLDLKGRPARLKKRTDQASFLTSLGNAMYFFLRARHTLTAPQEIRSFFHGYHGVLKPNGILLGRQFVRAVMAIVDQRLEEHYQDATLSTLIPNMPRSLSEICLASPNSKKGRNE